MAQCWSKNQRSTPSCLSIERAPPQQHGAFAASLRGVNILKPQRWAEWSTPCSDGSVTVAHGISPPSHQTWELRVEGAGPGGSDRRFDENRPKLDSPLVVQSRRRASERPGAPTQVDERSEQKDREPFGISTFINAGLAQVVGHALVARLTHAITHLGNDLWEAMPLLLDDAAYRLLSTEPTENPTTKHYQLASPVGKRPEIVQPIKFRQGVDVEPHSLELR